MTDPKLSDTPDVKAAFNEAIAGLQAEGMPEVWAQGVIEAVAEMVDAVIASVVVQAKEATVAAIRQAFDVEAVQNDRYARILDALPGQQATASWHRAMAERMRAKAKAVPGD